MELTPQQREYQRLHKHLLTKMRQACVSYNLLEDGDHILIGLSGGKDSLALVQLLGEQAKIHKPYIQVTAVHVSVSNIGYASDIEYLDNFCRQHGVNFCHITTSFSPRQNDRRTQTPCFLCARYRRNALLDTALRLGCNKLAFGHHRDDIIQTLLMNLTLNGNFSTMPPRLKLDKMPLTVIRPLSLIDEADIKSFAELADYHKQVKTCPFERETARNAAAELLSQMEKLNPDVRSSVWAAMENIKTDYLPHKLK